MLLDRPLLQRIHSSGFGRTTVCDDLLDDAFDGFEPTPRREHAHAFLGERSGHGAANGATASVHHNHFLREQHD